MKFSRKSNEDFSFLQAVDGPLQCRTKVLQANLLTRALNIHLNVEHIKLLRVIGVTERRISSRTRNSFSGQCPASSSIPRKSLSRRTSIGVTSCSFFFIFSHHLSLFFSQYWNHCHRFGSSLNTNLSRPISLSWMDQQGNEIPLLIDAAHPFEIVIPRDPSLIIPPTSLYNVTG